MGPVATGPAELNGHSEVVTWLLKEAHTNVDHGILFGRRKMKETKEKFKGRR